MKYEDWYGAQIDFLADPDPDGFIAVSKLEHNIAARSNKRGKSEDHGSWPVFTYYESVSITLEGSIQAGSSSQFNSFLTYTSQILMPQPLIKQPNRTQGTFKIRNVGSNNIWEIPVSVEVPLQTPREATSPARTEFHLGFIAYRPWYYEPKTNQYYWPS